MKGEPRPLEDVLMEIAVGIFCGEGGDALDALADPMSVGGLLPRKHLCVLVAETMFVFALEFLEPRL